MNKSIKNLPASVRQRLLNLSRDRKEDFQLLLTRFGLERLMYRLAQSEYSEQFVVKGAILFSLWAKESYRTTHDLDLMTFHNDAVPQLVTLFQNLCRQKVENDGIIFESGSVHGEIIREDQP